MEKTVPGKIMSVLTRVAFMFCIGGLVGWLYEVFICAPLNQMPIDLTHGGLGIPFLMIYGAGSALIELALGLERKQGAWWVQLLAIIVLTTTVEYVTGLIMLRIVGVQTWDYHLPGWDFLVSPDGLVCLRASLTFGLMGLLQLRGLSRLYEWTFVANAQVLRVAVWLCFALVVLALLNGSFLHIVDTGGMWH
ncbi:putative ABC transporter permease [Atopobium sp. oral taxon 810]|uniref:putative ABC transporter permease n=1 Tax=Atopobium sp. oral taxon 810 TaxID=712158 RepID=UPI00040FE077|nr:putative ABC transporter permease [Atopobium sp. oral taxon 810]